MYRINCHDTTVEIVEALSTPSHPWLPDLKNLLGFAPIAGAFVKGVEKTLPM